MITILELLEPARKPSVSFINSDLVFVEVKQKYPRLSGNWTSVSPTPKDDYISTRLAKVNRASIVADLGTNPCSFLNTI